MAAKEVEETEKRDVKVKALINLKYDKDIVKIGGELLIRGSELEDMLQAGYVAVVK